MSIFGSKKKKEQSTGQCDCGGKCNAQSPVKEEPTCSCGGICNCNNNGSTVIKVLGSGCAKCNQLEANVKSALSELGKEIKIEHVTDFKDIATYGVMSTPALVVNNKVVSYGKVLKENEAVKILKDLI